MPACSVELSIASKSAPFAVGAGFGGAATTDSYLPG
jgi:hypothetical protein